MAYGMDEKVRAWFYVDQALLWISVAENRSQATNFSRSLRQQPTQTI